MLQNQGGSVLVTINDARMVLNQNTQEINTSLDIDNIDDDDDDDANIEDPTDSQVEILHDLSLPPSRITDVPTFLLLYLNKHTFEGNAQDQNEFKSIIQSCIDDSDISIVLVHEKDTEKGGCDFGDFFGQAPEELIRPPNNLFRDIAIPLYSTQEYHIISLRHILCKMGATVKSKSKKRSVMRTIKNAFLARASSSYY
jgi:hypothetical protein